ncbi:S-adenosyl-L-methionine-dependent methyltransferase, partial [Violaceomyces palustris]
SGVPTFSRSTLMHLGMVEGITPPAPAGLPDISNSIEVSSVVSAGLEMGLGVSLAASALINHIPGASSAVSGLAEPRYSRATGGSFDMGSLAMGLKLTDTQIAKPSVPAANLSDKAEESPLTTLEHAESELSRRRTTGWMVGKARADQAPKTGTRHQRSGTHDPVVGNARRNDMSTGTSPGQGPVAVPNRIMFDSLPPAGDANVERNSSIGGGSQARASAGGSTLPETPSLGDKAMLSPDASQHTDSRNPFNSLGPRHGHQQGETRFGRGGRDGQYGNGAAGLGPGHGGLMGIGGGGHFGPGVRAKVAEVLPKLIAGIPLLGQEGETVHIAEYGCLNSRSTQLLQPIISLFAEKAHANQPQREAEPAEVPDYFGRAEVPAMRTIVGGGAPLDMPCRVNFSVTHEDSPQADFRPVTLLLDTSSESYLNPHWQSAHEPSLQNTIFPSFVSRPFASRIVPPSTMHLGMSLMDLHWAHTPRNPAVSLATSAHAELTAFLTARAHEFRKDGVFVMAYISRSEEDRFTAPDRPKSTIDYDSRDMSCGSPLSGSALDDMADGGEAPARGPIKRERTRSNSTPLRPNVLAQNQVTTKKSADIWTTLTNTLAPCLQRLVSCGMLKSDVARHLLSLPMHPRTPRHTQNVLKSVKHLWRLEWSCGLGEGTSELQKDGVIDEDSSVGDATAKSRTGPGVLQSEPEPLRLPHPAWKALQAGTLSRVAFAEHMIQLFKNLYESHFRSVLREKGKLSKGAVEFVLDSLWDILHSRIDDQQPCPIAQCELEVQVVALRRV